MKWEYLTITHIRLDDEDELDYALEGYGKQGWELVSDVVSQDRHCLIFKKPVK